MEAHARGHSTGVRQAAGNGLTLAITRFKVRAVIVAVVEAAKYGISTSLREEQYRSLANHTPQAESGIIYRQDVP